jgi:glycine cleavage system regulatory protein
VASLVLTVIGDDRPGLVSSVSGLVEARGGSWQRSQMARLAGKFAGIALVEVPQSEVAALEAELAALATPTAGGLHVVVTLAGDEPDPVDARSTTAVHLRLLGQDRPGIVAEVSAALAGHGVGIDELTTDVREAPMAGGTLFEVEARLSLPVGSDVGAVRDDLERLADELMVDLSLDADLPAGPLAASPTD